MAVARVTQVAVEVLRGPAGSRCSQVVVEALRPNARGSRASLVALEVLRRSPALRVTQTALEALRSNAHGVRQTQVAVEALRPNAQGVRGTQVALEALRPFSRGLRATQSALEVLRPYRLGARPSQVALEVLRTNTYPVYVTQVAEEVLRPGDGMARVTQAAKEALRTGDGLTRITSLVMEVLRSSAEEGVLPIPDVAPWPFQANAAAEILERYGYQSEVLRARQGVEQRRLLRATASGVVAFTSTLTTAIEAAYAANFISAYAGQAVLVPLWQYQKRLTAAASDHTIIVDTTDVPFYANAAVMLWQDPWALEVAQVETVSAGYLSLRNALATSWPARTTILVPLVLGYLREREEMQRHDLQVGDLTVEFAVPAFFP